MKRLCSLMLILIMVAVYSAPAFATTGSVVDDLDSDNYIAGEVNAKYERNVSETGIVTVTVKSLEDDSTLAVVQNINGEIYLDGTMVYEIPVTTSNSMHFENERSLLEPFASSTITWANWSTWQTVLDEYPTGGISMAILYGVVAAVCPWVGFSAISGALGVIAGSYDYITIKMRIRYGNDGKMFYYERQTRFYGDSVLEFTFADKGSEPL